MDDQSCLTNSQWERYSKKLLTNPELLHMQKHVMDCALCADIKEGIDAMKRPADLSNRVDSINLKVDAFINPSRNVNSVLWYWSAAAVIVLGIAMSWILLNRKSEIVSQNNQGEIHQSTTTDSGKTTKPLIQDTVLVAVVEQAPIKYPATRNPEVVKSDGKANEEAVTPATQYERKDANTDDAKVEYKSPPTTNATVQKANDSIVQSDVAVTATKALDDEQYTYREKKLDKTESTNKIPSNKNVEQQTVVKRKTRKESSKAEPRTAMPSAANNSPNYAGNEAYDSVYKNNNRYVNSTINDSNDYVLAIKNYDTGFYDKCLINLYYLTMNPASGYYERGLLLKARALLKLNKKEDAKVALQTVIKMNREKKQEAQELLNTIK